MQYARWSIGALCLGLLGCASTSAAGLEQRALRVLPSDEPVSHGKNFELSNVADELKIDEAGTLASAAKDTGYDECMESLACTYCRKYDGWWMRRRCE